ncbi:Survival motor neuron protein [Armadillidium nasatum]|uniref:Survival motor neuron protein n=1 Tax=Armadillidium nasatum TaxID=96803 RepID=A0A5N5SM44_9CRUS|nr:Survival motor neuron protein [Armadillidium nasatum]
MDLNDTGGQILFDKNSNPDGQLTHNEIWDDSLLIQHYDETMNMARKHLANKLPSVSSVTDSECSNSHRTELVNGYSHNKVHLSTGVKKKKKKRCRKKNEWHIGDPCRAMYSKDGEAYEATIVGINNAKGTCTVRYLGYNNHEEMIQSSLLRSKGEGVRRRQVEDVVEYLNEADGSSEGSYGVETGESEMEGEASKHSQHSQHSRDYNMQGGPSQEQPRAPNPMTVQPEHSFPHIPNLPPPPALGLVDGSDPLTSEALAHNVNELVHDWISHGLLSRLNTQQKL